MNSILKIVEKLRKDPIRDKIENRMKEFESFKEKSDEEIFNELCFCLLTANFNAEGGIRIQKEIGEGFSKNSEKELAKKLSALGHRFPNARARYIFEAQKHKKGLKKNLESFDGECEAREWIVKNVKGLGFKEASHFLRNIGYQNVAIIDFHIINLLVKNNLIEKPKTISKKNYTEIEKVLEKISKKTGLSLGELDLYLWYEETGKVLK